MATPGIGEESRKIVNNIIRLIKESEATSISKLIEICAGLTSQIGKSIAHVEDDITISELRKMYLSDTTPQIEQLGIALMLQASLVLSWKEDYLKMVGKRG